MNENLPFPHCFNQSSLGGVTEHQVCRVHHVHCDSVHRQQQNFFISWLSDLQYVMHENGYFLTWLITGVAFSGL